MWAAHMSAPTLQNMAAAPANPPPRAFLPALFSTSLIDSFSAGCDRRQSDQRYMAAGLGFLRRAGARSCCRRAGRFRDAAGQLTEAAITRSRVRPKTGLNMPPCLFAHNQAPMRRTSHKILKKKKDSVKLKFHLARTRIAPIGRGGGKAEMAAPKQKGVCGRPAQRSTALSLAVALPTTCAPRH